jgi:hypothetical protein
LDSATPAVASRRSVAGVAGCILAAGVLLSSCGAGKTASNAALSPDVTPQQIRSVLLEYSRENNISNEIVSVQHQALDETGSALAIDDSSYQYQLQAGQGPSWQQHHYKPFFEYPLQMQASGTHHSWPRSFVAIAAQTSSPTSTIPTQGSCDTVFVFVQSRRSGRWRAAWEPWIARSLEGRVRLAPVGIPLQANDPNLYLTPAALAYRLTFSLGIWGNGGSPPSWLSSSVARSCFGLNFLGGVASAAAARNESASVTVQVWPHAGAIASYPLEHGGALVLIAIATDLHYQPNAPSAPGSYSYISVKVRYGNLVPGVEYASLTYPGLAEVAVWDPARGHGKPVILGAYYNDLWPATGVKGTVSSTQTG